MARLSQQARAELELTLPPAEVAPEPSAPPPAPVAITPRTREYLERNRRAWDRWAQQYAPRARATWEAPELRWGLWETPESQLRLFEGLEPGTDVVELGSGPAGISAWAARRRLRPVAVDISTEQLRIADVLQRQSGVVFPLVNGNAENVPFDNESFDVAVSEYGASLWCNPRRWLPEAHRLLRPGGKLVFFTNGAFLLACTANDGAPAEDQLVRPYFSRYEVEFANEEAVEFHLTHGHWIRMLRSTGFVLEDLIEVRPPRDAKPRYRFVSLDWARRWPSEEIWIARRVPHRG